MLEYAADQQNLSDAGAKARVWGGVAAQLNRVLHLMGDELGIEGSWSGNDTIWRTGLDLNRIILCGNVDGSMGSAPQRRVVHLADAIVAGQGDGPLSPQPLPLGLLFAGNNPAVVDWYGARLLGYDPELLPIVREAFGSFKWPIATSRPSDELNVKQMLPVIYPSGWRDAAATRA